MHQVPGNCFYRFFISITFLLGGFFSYAQPPGTTPVNPNTTTLPVTTPTTPVNMNGTQLQNMLKDQNAEPGTERNKDLNNDRINKDSLDRASATQKSNDPKSTYGANAFLGAGGISTSELSTPPADYPIGVGDHVIVSMYGGAEFQGNFIVGTDGSDFPQRHG